MAGSNKIVEACEQHWGTWKGDCSGFVKAVAAEVGIILTGQANDIVTQIQNEPWNTLADGVEAKMQAEEGLLVIGGLQERDHGHVVVVVPGELNRGQYPTAYWGRLGGEGKKNSTINWSWKASDRDKVIYASCPISGTNSV
jgi:hypothetical protein